MNRSFRLFWSGEIASLLGAATTSTLLPLIAVLDLGADAGWLGVITAAAWAPWLILGLLAGGMVDALPPRHVMITADLVGFAAAASIPLAATWEMLTLAHLVAVAFVIGGSNVFFRAALPRLIVRIVDAEHTSTAASRMFAAESGSAIVGPGLAGLVARITSPALGMLIDAASFLVSALCLWRVREPHARSEPAAVPTEPLVSRIREGLAVIVRDPVLRFCAIIAPVQNVGFVGLLTLQVLYMVDTLGLTASSVGFILALAGVGGLLGALAGPPLARRLGDARAVVILQLTSVGCLLIPLAFPGPGIALMAIGLIFAEAPIVADNVIRSGWRLRYVPERLQARIGASIQVLAFGSMPLAALVAGWLGEHLGARTALAIVLTVHVAAALTFPFSPIGRSRHLPLDFAARHPERPEPAQRLASQYGDRPSPSDHADQ